LSPRCAQFSRRCNGRLARPPTAGGFNPGQRDASRAVRLSGSRQPMDWRSVMTHTARTVAAALLSPSAFSPIPRRPNAARQRPRPQVAPARTAARLHSQSRSGTRSRWRPPPALSHGNTAGSWLGPPAARPAVGIGSGNPYCRLPIAYCLFFKGV
jgi:hypothetical protein